MVTQLRAAVIGCGGAGRNHAAGYERADGAELVAVCDLDEELATGLADEHDVASYADLDTLLDEESPDVVSVTTPEHLHVGPATTALEAGADVFCEKIMAHSLSSGRDLVETAERTGGVLGVNYNYRHMPIFERLRAAIDDEFGTIRLADVGAHSYCWHHAIDLLRYFLGEPTRVRCTTRQDPEEAFWDYSDELLYVPAPAASATFEFDSGAIASLSASTRSTLEDRLLDVAVHGDDGHVRITDVGLADTSGTLAPDAIADEWDVEGISLDEAFERSVAAFVRAVKTGERPPTTGADGYRMLEIERAVVRSANEDRPVEL